MDVNSYGRQLTPAEIDAKAHREFVGGMWDEIGALQLDFMRGRGLKPSHRFVDVGCGALRGGVHFVRYLERSRYHGLDVNASLIEAGRKELRDAGLGDKDAQLLVSDRFDLDRFGRQFDYAIAVSLFTHLPMNHITVCLNRIARVLEPAGCFYASYFHAPTRAHLDPIEHPPAGIVTQFDRDPYHYSLDELRWMAPAQLDVERIGGWGHPRGQSMVAFRRIG
ncbi:MAG TPA: class I SAM-dependent methyltransferase [Casimicrobiaceae bacterium]|nr:class I SAM-dependent methyltransferase [Casimicrobiaceae bacterium]